jgi:hypothetical protein
MDPLAGRAYRRGQRSEARLRGDVGGGGGPAPRREGSDPVSAVSLVAVGLCTARVSLAMP